MSQYMRKPPTLRFDREWNAAADGVILAGGRLRVVYDAERLPSPRAVINHGMPAWSITCCYRFEPGTEIHAVAMFGVGSNSREGELEIDVPHTATEIELWFYVSDRWGHREWDSHYGENFHFPIVSINHVIDAATLRLNDDGSITVERSIAPATARVGRLEFVPPRAAISAGGNTRPGSRRRSPSAASTRTRTSRGGGARRRA